MYRVSIRDLLWLTLVVGLTIALWMEHARSYKATVAAAHFHKCFDNLARFAVEEGNWKIVWGENYLTVYRPSDPLDQPAFDSAWRFHQNPPGLDPLAGEWSRESFDEEF